MERGVLAKRIEPTALVLFSEHGFHGTSMQRIADALGVSRAAFYYHYPSKQALLEALCAPVVEAFEAVATRAEDVRTASDDLLTGFLEVLHAHEPVLRFVSNDPAVQAASEAGPRLRAAYDRIVVALAGSIASPAADVVAACALGALTQGVLAGAVWTERREVALAAARAVVRSASPAGAPV